MTEEKREVVRVLDKADELRDSVVELNKNLQNMNAQQIKWLNEHYFDKADKWNWNYGHPFFPVGLNTVNMSEYMTDIDAVHEAKDGRMFIFESKYKYYPNNDKQVTVQKNLFNRLSGKKVYIICSNKEATYD